MLYYIIVCAFTRPRHPKGTEKEKNGTDSDAVQQKERDMRIGFIGCGGFSRGTHIPNAVVNPNFEIVAFCDLSESILNELNDQYHPEYVTTDMDRLMNDDSIEMVVCGTKPDFRLPIMESAVASGKHLFVEKPMCFDNAEIKPMVALMKDAPVKFMVGFNRPYSPIMRMTKDLYKKHRSGNTTIIYRIIGEAQLWPKHHHDAVVRDGESTIIHEITHIFDLLRWLTDSTPVSVYTAGEGNMDNIITLRYPDKVTAVIIAGDNGSAGFPKERLEINTNHGVIVADMFVELSATGYGNGYFNKLFPCRVDGEPKLLTGVELAEQLRLWRRSVTQQEMDVGYYYDRMPKIHKGHAEELEAFRKIIENDLSSETDVFAGATANLLASEALESWRIGAPRRIDFSDLAE